MSFAYCLFTGNKVKRYTLWISRCIATARERIPGSIANYVTGVRECSQQRGNLKDNGYSYSPTAPGENRSRFVFLVLCCD
ncbi:MULTISPECIES: hypothetical protein [Photorhabdus]|uniref:hypothetical protein n=1 Tax=Photorhabdus TaxID=29487 RepID=UPI000308EAAF|nr:MULTISPECIES: hypothetical protein [Photorhabdus]NDK93314.1 hypothetical protein [Photorhabdus laumondii subsp. laumondii]NDL49524.1 hypothetical protein [Photorhabdus laumondii subsp. laumondii]